MLEAVGRPVAVNPDRALAKIAREAQLGDPQLHEADPAARPRRAHDPGRDDEPRRRRRCADPLAPRPHRGRTRPGGAPPESAGARLNVAGLRLAERRAAITPRATSRARMMSFFMTRSYGRCDVPLHGACSISIEGRVYWRRTESGANPQKRGKREH